MRQRSNEAHRHSKAQHPDISWGDAWMPHAAGGDLFHSGLGLGQSGDRSSFPDSGILIFTCGGGDCAALSFENSGAERQTGWYGPLSPDWYRLLPDFSNPDYLTDGRSDVFARMEEGGEGAGIFASQLKGASDSQEGDSHVTNITVAMSAIVHLPV